MQHFRNLKVWHRAHALVLDVYRLTGTFPAAERFGLTSQLRRAALSVPTNTVEGSKRRSNLEYARFLNVAEASLAEAEYLLLVARDLGYAPDKTTAALMRETDEIARMLSSLRTKVEKEAS